MNTPIEIMLDRVEWTARPDGDIPDDGELYSTHEGVLELFGFRLRCYRLSNGSAVVNSDDMQEFLSGSFDS